MSKAIKKLKKEIRRCKRSTDYFINSFCKVKHPNAGIIPFKTFSYQKKCLKEFKSHRFNIFGKTRQCFAGDNVVWTSCGPKMIKDITKDDLIYTLNQKTGCLEFVNPSDVIDNGIANDMVEVRTKSGHRSICTPDHLFLTTNGYVQAGDLTTNDMLVEVNQEHYTQASFIKSVKPILGEYNVYDLNVPPHHNYVVDGVVVHNCGISTLSGAYALWTSMFHNNKTILITSKTDRDAKEFMDKNIRFVYNNLPAWMRAVWVQTISNEHEIGFSNGSKIKSLPSGPNVLRQYSSTLNIIDEAAFTSSMEEMWASGYPTLQHGGHVIVISTSNGIGNWYWQTWTDAIDGYNEFNPIVIDWWEMDWELKYKDGLSSKEVRICPTHNLKKCETREEKDKYGEYWSPWLEEQYRALTKKGNSNKFRQEVLRDFLGSGNTVLSRETLLYIKDTQSKDYKTIDYVQYVHPINGNAYNFDFNNQLWIWKLPQENHSYVAGIDISSGEATDYSAIEVFDLTTGEQVAELQIKCETRELSAMADYIGRWYNTAFLVPERTGIGVTVCQDLNSMNYPSLFRKNMMPNSQNKQISHTGPVGFPTSGQGKPMLNKALTDNTGQDGYTIYSHRLLKQLETYIHLGGGRTGAEMGSMNDDLVLATALSFMGINLAISSNENYLVPFNNSININDPGEEIQIKNDHQATMPMVNNNDPTYVESKEAELNNFTNSLINHQRPSKTVSDKKNPGDMLIMR